MNAQSRICFLILKFKFLIQMKKILLLFATVLLLSCSSRESVDLLIKNAVVYTVNKDFETASGFVVRYGKIIEVGDSEMLEAKYKAKEVYDAGGKTIVPGLIDAHAHLYGLGLYMQSVDLTGTKSFEEMIDRVVEFQKNNPSEYIQGRGWDQNNWPDKEFPTKQRLDELFPDTPVALRRVDGHAMLVNSKALKMAGITADTKIPGGEILLMNGEPTGVLIDNAMDAVSATIPPPDRQISEKALLDAEKTAISFRLTTVDDAGLEAEIIDLIDELQRDGKMKLKIYAMVSNSPENIEAFIKKGIYKTKRLNVRSFKIFV